MATAVRQAALPPRALGSVLWVPSASRDAQCMRWALLEAQGPQEETPEDTVQAVLAHQVDSHRGVGGPEGELDPRARLETPLVLEASRRTPAFPRSNRGPRTGRSRVVS